MIYSTDELDRMAEAYEIWVQRQGDLYEEVLGRTWQNSTAEEYAQHGLARRLNQLRHCLERTFATIPPESVNSPSRTAMLDTAVFAQSFMMNVSGACDNLARIWYHEKVEHSQELGRHAIGLRPKHRRFRPLLGPKLRDCLERFDDWFGYLENYRDAFAHRIPLYVVPRLLTEAEGEAYQDLDRRMGEAIQRRDFESYERLNAEQEAIGSFGGQIMHSIGENARPIRLHGQMISDLASIVQFGEALIADLEALPE